MKKFLFGCLLVGQSLVATEASAGPCVSDSLLAYTTLGAGGCKIGAFTFTSFTRQGLSEGATAIDGISVTPVSGGGLFGLDFTLTQGAVESFVGIESVSAPPTTVLESRISFQVTGTSRRD